VGFFLLLPPGLSLFFSAAQAGGRLPAAPWFLVVVLGVLAFLCIVIGLIRFVFGCVRTVLAFPCFVIGLLASPLCGAALTFSAAAKKVSKESGLQPPARRCPPLYVTGSGARRDAPSPHLHPAFIRSSVALRAPPTGTTATASEGRLCAAPTYAASWREFFDAASHSDGIDRFGQCISRAASRRYCSYPRIQVPHRRLCRTVTHAVRGRDE
jgi:hypothetical protein